MIGCADDAQSGDDEVGDSSGDSDEDGGTEPQVNPFDPLEGGGGVPPTTSNPTTIWTPPSTLGNGLVHDSRLDLESAHYEHEFANADLADGVPWSQFVDSYRARTQVGFRPAQLRARVTASPAGGGKTLLQIVDDSVYVCDDDANYQTEIETYVFGNVTAEREFANFAPATQGARPVSIDTFALEGMDEVGDSIAWIYDDSPSPWLIVAGQSQAELLDELDELGGKGFRPISIASRRRGQANEYSAIFVSDAIASENWAATLALPTAALASEIQARWLAGFYPLRGSGRQGSSSAVNLIWARRPPGISVQIRLDLDIDAFMAEDGNWRARGYSLESVARYEHEGPRMMAVWTRHEPFLRWQGTIFAPDDVAYQARYAMFNDQAIRTMSRATEIDCSGGQACPTGTSCYACPDDDTACLHEGICVEPKFRAGLRPSATLHVFEGDQLVLNRAYTFAPAPYPETHVNTPMKLASVSKSITAAALVRELAAQGLDLSAPFNMLAGIDDAPAAMDPVSVLDVLRNRGGFTPDSKSYLNHEMIADAMLGTIPIEGEALFDYVIAGHLGIESDDNYWDAGLFSNSQNDDRVWYSNSGFSMLGELLRILSGTSYEAYVSDHLFAPVGVDQTIFPALGHRRGDPGVTLAGLRSYLVNDDHPYHLKPAQQAVKVGDCGEALGWRWDGLTCSQMLACGCQGPDCDHLYTSLADCQSDHLAPRFAAEPVPRPLQGDASTSWADEVGPIDPTAPARASQGRYSGNYYMGGALLAAGGWHGDGESLGILIRALCQGNALMANQTASALWSPQWWTKKGSPAASWNYGLGWYIRGNWVAWAGGAEGSMATVLHNRAYDFTVVYLSNALGNGVTAFMNPLMTPVGQTWNTSPVGVQFPCLDDPNTPASECDSFNPPFTAPY